MKKTGELLKKAREDKGLSLNEVGLSLKISSKVLKAIEEGDESQLPAKTFLRGFVKSYATFLRLDADKILETFYEEMGSTKPKPYIRPETTGGTKVEAEEIPAEQSMSEATVTPIRKTQEQPAAAPKVDTYRPLHEKKNTKSIIAFVVGICLVGLIIFTKKMIDKYSKEAEVPATQAEAIEGATPVVPPVVDGATPEASASPEASPLNSITTKPEADSPMTSASPLASPAATISTTKPAVTPSVSPIAAASPSATPAATAKATPHETASASPSPSPVASTSPSPSASPTPSASPSPKEEKNKPVELIVEALDTVEIEYAAPNGKPQKIKLSAEQVHTFKSKSGLRISFSNGGAVNLILNGKDLGIPGDLGKPIKLSY